MTSAAAPIGLIAGSGRFPVLFAEAALRQGREVAAVGIAHEDTSGLPRLCKRFTRLPVTRISAVIRSFQRWGVRELVMAGKVHKHIMFTPGIVWHAVTDPRLIRIWYFGRLRHNKRDDSILLTMIDEFAKDGLRFRSALEFCPELLVKQGVLTRRSPTKDEFEDVRFGWELAKEMGRLDVGQSVAVKQCAAIAIEAIEGTDRCIERAGELCKAGGWTLVKVAKPQQDRRFDVPAIGISTIENLHKARARVLAIEAGETIVVDESEVIALADRLGISIIAIEKTNISDFRRREARIGS
jgi:DUF1009 family protein